MRWNGQDEGSGDEDPNADPAKRTPNNSRNSSSGAADDEEGWTDWKNGEDLRKRFIRKTPGRIIHLGDGSELFTDRGGQFHDDDEDEDEDTSDGEQHDGGKKGESSSDEEEDEDVGHPGGGKMRVDGVAPPGPLPKLAEKGRALSPPPARHQSPFPQTIPPPPSPRPAQ